MSDVTLILQAIQRGERQATDQLLPLVYEELRRLAARRIAKEPSDQSLEATALVHEAYLRLVPKEPVSPPSEGAWEGRGHFYAAAAEAMRRILIERARRRIRRGGRPQELQDEPMARRPERSAEELMAVDEALEMLATEDPQKAELVKLRFYAGLSLEEAAACIGVSRATASRYWAYARAWLHDRLRQNDEES